MRVIFRKSVRDACVASIFLLPALAPLVIFKVLPLIQAFLLSLSDWNGSSAPHYIGFRNFHRLFIDPTFRDALVNNAIVAAAVPVGVLVPLLLALAIHNRIWGWRFFRWAFFLPVVFPPVAVGIVFSLMLRYDGAVNTGLRAVGLGGLTHQWLAETSTALPAVMTVILWSISAIGVIVFLGALGSVDLDLEDAARVEGASWVQVQWHVTVPQIRPVVEFWSVIVLIVSIGFLFPFIYTLTRGGPANSTMVVDFFIYTQAFQGFAFGYATAAGVVAFVILLLPVTLGLWLMWRRS